MVDLNSEIKTLIIETLDLEDIKIEDINDDLPLFGEGLGLDSIDALELGLALKKKYKITIAPDSGETKEHFMSVSALAKFITTSIDVTEK